MQNGQADASETGPCLKPPIQRVLIVGAGIAGLSAAHALQKQGIAFDVIDAQAVLGGVWGASGYEGLKAQGAGSLLSCFRLMAIHCWNRTDMHRNASLGSLVQCMRHVPTALACMLHVTSGHACTNWRLSITFQAAWLHELTYWFLRTGPWFMMAHPEFSMPDGKRRFGAYEYPSGKGSMRMSPRCRTCVSYWLGCECD